MTYVLFSGCLLVTFGPALSLFVLLVTRSNQLIILTIGGSFFWLISILLASIWWFIIPPLRASYWWVVPFSVLFQEAVRYGLYRVYAWGFRPPAEPHPDANQNQRLQSLTERPNQMSAALAIGLGSGATYALVMYTSVLWEAMGPGALFSASCPKTSLFMISAILASTFVLLHIFQSVVAFEAFRLKSWPRLGIVWFSHIAASLFVCCGLAGCAFIYISQSLANLPSGSCAGSTIPILLVTAAMGGVAGYTFLKSDLLTRKI